MEGKSHVNVKELVMVGVGTLEVSIGSRLCASPSVGL